MRGHERFKRNRSWSDLFFHRIIDADHA